jgi:DsbC/DsbD-like thiol-disulfide interchange protein
MVSKSSCGRIPLRLSLLSLALCLPLLWPQSGKDHLSVGQLQKVVGKRSDAVQTKIPVSIEPGFHVNSNTPSDDYLIPLKVAWGSLGALEGAQVSFPKPTTAKVGDESLSVFTGNIDLLVSFKVAAKAPAGPGVATGTLSYQACNDRACFPPKKIALNIPYQVQ